MSVKKVTELRHQGKLAEALTLAQSDYQQTPGEWTSNSLFWVLYDLTKKEYLPQKQLTLANDCVERMGDLLPEMIDDDGVGQRCYEVMLQRLQPNSVEVRSLSDLSKSDPVKAYEEIVAKFGKQAEGLSATLHKEFGWILYRYLKNSSDQLTSVQVRFLLRDYMQLANERPSLLHSTMLGFAVKFSKDHPDFNLINFVRLWSGSDNVNFRHEDWFTRAGDNGKEYGPLAADAAKECFKNVKADAQKRSDRQLLEWLKQLYSRVIEHDASDDWSLRNYARTCTWLGETDEPRTIYKKLLQRMPDTFYLWSELANLVTDNNAVRIGLLLEAKQLAGKEDFMGNLHMSLAKLFIEEGFAIQARQELAAYMKAKGEKVSYQYRALLAQAEAMPDNGTKPDVEGYVGAAQEYVFAELPLKYGIVDYVNQEWHKLHVVTQDSKYVFVKYKKSALAKDTFVKFRECEATGKDGTRHNNLVCVQCCSREEALPHFSSRIVIVDDVNDRKNLFHVSFGPSQISGSVRFDQTDLRPKVGDSLRVSYCVKTDKEGKKHMKFLDIARSEQEDPSLLRTVTGTLKVKYRNGDDYGDGPSFAFVGDYYVHRNLLRQHSITSDCQVTAKALPDRNGKWRVFALHLLPHP